MGLWAKVVHSSSSNENESEIQHSQLQLDPPECELLAAKRATVAFVDGGPESGKETIGLDLFV
jgi:hypothetical protein